jgi:hypothetical protein
MSTNKTSLFPNTEDQHWKSLKEQIDTFFKEKKYIFACFFYNSFHRKNIHEYTLNFKEYHHKSFGKDPNRFLVISKDEKLIESEKKTLQLLVDKDSTEKVFLSFQNTKPPYFNYLNLKIKLLEFLEDETLSEKNFENLNSEERNFFKEFADEFKLIHKEQGVYTNKFIEVKKTPNFKLSEFYPIISTSPSLVSSAMTTNEDAKNFIENWNTKNPISEKIETEPETITATHQSKIFHIKKKFILNESAVKSGKICSLNLMDKCVKGNSCNLIHVLPGWDGVDPELSDDGERSPPSFSDDEYSPNFDEPNIFNSPLPQSEMEPEPGDFSPVRQMNEEIIFPSVVPSLKRKLPESNEYLDMIKLNKKAKGIEDTKSINLKNDSKMKYLCQVLIWSGELVVEKRGSLNNITMINYHYNNPTMIDSIIDLLKFKDKMQIDTSKKLKDVLLKSYERFGVFYVLEEKDNIVKHMIKTEQLMVSNINGDKKKFDFIFLPTELLPKIVGYKGEIESMFSLSIIVGLLKE